MYIYIYKKNTDKDVNVIQKKSNNESGEEGMIPCIRHHSVQLLRQPAAAVQEFVF